MILPDGTGLHVPQRGLNITTTTDNIAKEPIDIRNYRQPLILSEIITALNADEL